MGRHNVPEELPPPKDKPRYRFVVAISAIFLLAFVSMAVVAAVFPQNAPQAEASPGDPGALGNPFPSISTGGGFAAGVGQPTPGTPGAPGTGVQPGTTAPTNPRGTSPAAGGRLSGAYAVSNEWADGFIGAVKLNNGTSAGQSWQVQLIFPDNVGALQARWIAGGPGEMTVARAGQTVTFTGQQPLAPGAHIDVSFQFAKSAGVSTPRTCSVNGQACGG